MDNIIEDNYKVTVDRGCISPSTTKLDFINKLFEEVYEFEESIYDLNWSNIHEELADVIMVCLNFAKHYKIDIEQEIKNKIEINRNRIKK